MVTFESVTIDPSSRPWIEIVGGAAGGIKVVTIGFEEAGAVSLGAGPGVEVVNAGTEIVTEFDVGVVGLA